MLQSTILCLIAVKRNSGFLKDTEWHAVRCTLNDC